MASSVFKVRNKFPNIPGTKPSIKNAQLLISTGIPSLDHILGGGLPIGSIFLLEEDTYGAYTEVMLKYFMAEGIVSKHSLAIASQNVKPSKLVSEIPMVLTESAPQQTPVHDNADQMKIAWRYQNMRMVDSSPTGQAFGHFYDLTKCVKDDDLKEINITQWDGESKMQESEIFNNKAYGDLLKTIQNSIKSEECFKSDTPDKRNVMRIVIHSLGSRLWLSDTTENTHQDILKFLYCLRSILRNSYAVAAITIPVNQFEHSNTVVKRMEHLTDISIKLEIFAGSGKETNPLFKDYHGLLQIKKLPAINSLASHNPESRDLVFKLRRKKFIIEILHLPPELEDTAQREQDEIVPRGAGCSSGTSKNLLDF